MQTPEQIFAAADEAGASDVHIVVGSPVLLRVNGMLTPLQAPPLAEGDVTAFLQAVLSPAALQTFQRDREVDASFECKTGKRLRLNCHVTRGQPSLVARVIPTDIPTLDALGFPPLVQELANLRDGLLLFTGPTGAGKSTSMAAIIRHISQARAANIITLEDPIEYIFPQGRGVVRQRQLGEDFLSFAEALKHVLRQDPDVVMVGEMRDMETIAAALTLAETGHLILATLHTPNAVQTIDRIVDVFPPHQQNQVRMQLSLSLRAVCAQRLVPKAGGGRVAQREILLNTPAVANVIRDNRMQELRTVMQTAGEAGMITFEKDAKRLRAAGLIDDDTAAALSA